LSETDLEGFVKHSHEQVIISAIEEGRRSTQKEFYRRLEEGSRRNWEKQKEGLWEELGRHGMAGAGGGGEKGEKKVIVHSFINTLTLRFESENLMRECCYRLRRLPQLDPLPPKET